MSCVWIPPVTLTNRAALGKDLIMPRLLAHLSNGNRRAAEGNELRLVHGLEQSLALALFSSGRDAYVLCNWWWW